MISRAEIFYQKLPDMYPENNRLAGTNVAKTECIKVTNIVEEKFYASALGLSYHYALES